MASGTAAAGVGRSGPPGHDFPPPAARPPGADRSRARDPRLDALRVAAALAVVCVHTAAPVVVTHPDPQSWGWWLGNLADSLSRWCVPVFVMVSGALLLPKASEVEPLRFYGERARRLLPPLLFWTVFYLAFSLRDRPLSAAQVARELVSGTPYYHLWYLYMAVGLYLATPFLRAIVLAASPAAMRVFLALSFAGAVCSPFTGSGATFLTLFAPYVGYYVAGHELYRRSASGAPRAWLGMALGGGVLVAIVTALLWPRLGQHTFDLTYSFLDPLVIATAIAVFQCGLGSGPRGPVATRAVAWAADLSLGIYLTHPFFLRVLAHFGLDPFWVHPVVGIPATLLAATVLSAAATAALAAVPGLRRGVA